MLPHEKHNSLKSALIHLRRGKKGFEKQHVLNDISFEITKGQFFGVIGRNGNGKSTLLKLLAGIYTPDKGAIEIKGKLTPFIELGVGFNPELSGRENVFLNGALLGFNRKEMEAMYDDIVEFAELERFMDQKLKNYSSGMQVRLAFSIAIRARTDILLIDEVLAVGDVNFQKKCMTVFEDLKRQGRTIIFISHSMDYVRLFCDRVAVLDNGKVIYDGNTEKAIDIYNKLNLRQEKAQTEIENKKTTDIERLGNGKALIKKYEILNHNMKESAELVTDKEFTARLIITAKETVNNCAVGIMFRKDQDINLFGLNSFTAGHPIKEIKAGETLEIVLKDKLPLNPGLYYVSFEVATMTSTGYEDIDYLVNVFKINVVGPKLYWAVVSSSPTISTKIVNGTSRKLEATRKDGKGEVFMIDMWCRRVMNAEVEAGVKKMPYKKMDILEISGTDWKSFGFKSYTSLAFPEFDICKQATDRQYDLIIAEQVFEHIEDPTAAADNILKMLRPGGTFLITTPFLIKYHPSPLDMWRWTKQALKVFLEQRGYDTVDTFSWGNKECVIANLEDWPPYDEDRHSLENDERYPIMVWGFAHKPKKSISRKPKK